MGNSNYKRDDPPEYRYSLTTRNPNVIELCEQLRKERKLSSTIEGMLESFIKKQLELID